MTALLYDPRSGLSERHELVAGTAFIDVLQFDATYVYTRRFTAETIKADGTWLYRYTRTRKRKVAWTIPVSSPSSVQAADSR